MKAKRRYLYPYPRRKPAVTAIAMTLFWLIAFCSGMAVDFFWGPNGVMR